MYAVAYKVDKALAAKYASEGATEYSDEYGATFRTIRAAQAFIAKLRKSPASVGAVEWMSEASLWIVDSQGRYIAE